MDIIPGLKGFGTDTRAAYGAANDPEICIVDSILTTGGDPSWNAAGYSVGVYEGTLRQCLALDTTGGGVVDGHTILANSGKVIIFKVSGTINATSSPYEYEIDYPYTSILGQTAPSPGITLKGIMVKIKSTHDVLIQHIRSRPGDNPYGILPDYSHSMIITSGSADTYNIVFDHCSSSWAIDGLGLFWEEGGYDTYDCSWTNSIFAEPLHDSLHSKGPHGYGMVVNTNTQNISVIKNMFMSSYGRNPRIVRGSRAAVNNYVYNPGAFSFQVVDAIGAINLSMVSNFVEGGPDSGVYSYQNHFACDDMLDTSEIYMYDNKCGKEGEGYHTQASASDWTQVRWWGGQADISVDVKLTSASIWPTGLVALDVDDVKTHVLANVGARPADRDEVDTRLISEAEAGTGSIKDSVVDGTIYYPIGTAQGWSINTIVLESLYIDFADNVLNGRVIEITAGTGNGQSRTISDWVKSTLTATVSVNWTTTPDGTSEYRVLFTSTNGAGGYPTLSENETTLSIPANPHVDAGDGYTYLEVWLQALAASVEGTTQCTQIIPIQSKNPKIKPKWQLPVGVMEGMVAHNCRINNMPRPSLAMPLWEGAGNQTIDFSGHGNHAQFYNEASWIAEGIHTDGVNDYIRSPHDSSIDFADEDFTVSLWFRTTTTEASSYLFSKNYGGTGVKWYGSNIFVGGIACYVDDGGASPSTVNTTDDFNDGKWHNLVYSRNTTTNKLTAYIDGVWNAEATDISGSIANTGTLTIGGRNDLNVDRFYDGDLKQFCIYDVALTERQIKFQYDNPYFMYQIPEEIYGQGEAAVGGLILLLIHHQNQLRA